MHFDSVITGFFLIFLLRVCDVSLGTMRMVYMLQGRKRLSTMIGFVEVFIFIYAISTVVSGIMADATGPSRFILMLGYASGFATGTFLGLKLEEHFAIGMLQLRIISREHGRDIADALWAEDFGGTLVDGQGHTGSVEMIFSIVQRKYLDKCIEIARRIDEECVISTSDSRYLFRGYLGHHGKRK